MPHADYRSHGVDDVFGGGHLGDIELIVGHHSIKKGAGIFEDLQIEGNTFWLNRTSPGVPKLNLTLACGPYDRFEALRNLPRAR